MTLKVVITATACQQLDEACQWYESRAPEIAPLWYNGFLNALKELKLNPEQYSLARENDIFNIELRQFLYGFGKVKTHRAIFTIQETRIVVHRIAHLAQRDLELGDI